MREGTFPRQVRLGPNSVAWLQSTISEWMTSVVESTSSVHKMISRARVCLIWSPREYSIEPDALAART
ncbi:MULTISPECIES: AlpA family phage regulatory protein [Pseudomonas]|uniref:AlpA family phage regulatory protein n=1 Tax=Pseudomonas TaxID=286 RepID=UPI002A818AC5|nr:AlpA family phage regulatory protein [Pseudomonas putida]